MISGWTAALISTLAFLLAYRIGLFVGRFRQTIKTTNILRTIHNMGKISPAKAVEIMGRVLEKSIDVDELRKADD